MAIYNGRKITMNMRGEFAGVDGVDDELSPTSENPVQNKVVTAALDGKQDKINASQKLSSDYVDDTNTTNKFVATADKTRWDGKQSPLAIETDTTSTTKILTLSPNIRYVLGELSSLTIYFPSSGNSNDTIVIEFVSGSPYTNFIADTTHAIYNFEDINENKFVELNAEYKASIGKWVVYSAETTYPVPVV